MNRKISFVAIISFSIFALFLAGCGGKEKTGDNSGAPEATAVVTAVPQTPEPTEVPTPVPTPTPEPTLFEKLEASGRIRVSVCADYPPYEFYDSEGALVGADIELAKYIAEGLGLELLIVEESDLESVLTDIDGDIADIAISCIADTDERREAYAVSDPYGGRIVREEEDGEASDGIEGTEDAEVSDIDETAANAETDDAVQEEPLTEAEIQAVQMEGGMVIIGAKTDDTVMKKINSLLYAINTEGLYDTFFDDALMLAEKMRLF